MLSSIGQTRFYLILLFFLLGPASPAFAMDFNASWLYRQTGGEDIDTREEFQQRYSLGIGPSLTYRPTHAISASASVGYTRTHRDQGQGMTTVDEITPSAQLSLINDIFLAQLSGSTTSFSSDSRFDDTSRFWGTTLASRWDIPFWPSLRLNYGEQTDPIDNTKAKTSSMAVDWNLRLAQLYYQFSNSRIEDEFTNNLVESDSHFARFESAGSLWHNRIGLNFAQQFQTSTQDLSLGTAGEVSFPIQVGGQATARIDPVNPDPIEPVYEDPEETLPQAVGFDQSVHLRFSTGTGFSELIDLLRLTLGSFTEAQAAASLQWSVFFRKNQFDPWEPVPGTFQGVTSEDDENIIEIPIDSIQATEVLVVAENDSGLPLTIAAVETFFLPTEDFSSRTTSYLTNLGTRIRLTRTLTASSNVTLENFESGSGENISENNRRSVSGRLRWTPVPFVTPSIGFSENREERTGDLEQINRLYSLTVATIPLQTMNVTFGATRYERYSGEQETASGNRYSVTSNARIYPDLNAALFVGYGENRRLDKDGRFVDDTTFNSRLNLNARFYRALTGDITANYRQIDREETSTESADATFSLAYRPSDLLALRGAYSILLFGDIERDDRLTLGLTLGLIRTYKTRLTLDANHSQTGDRETDTFALDGSWDISRNLALQSRANYIMGTRDSYSFQAYLTLRL